ncbi:hypothetical protein [Nocardia sp. NRRL S-836]|uniref:hypothetical protein n=1 Tax=Nocardia sp. NRRL S-836 TaxID=1519492 RepID=UPI0012FC1128|nr:hypothetical protein [Nocardia sp. NRRL S-836]
MSLALLGAVVAGFVINTSGPAPFVALLVVVACAALAGYALLKLRPASSGIVAPPLVVFALAALGFTGGDSLWLTAFGDQVSCEVVSVNTHTSRRSPTSYSNDLMCGSQRIASHFPDNADQLGKPGDRVGLVIDRTGVVRVLAPSKVTWWRNLLVPAAAVLGATYVVLVVRLPRRRPKNVRVGDFL